MLKIPHFEFPSAPHCTQHQAALLLCLSSHIRPRTSYLVPCPSVHRFVPVVIKLFIMAAYRANQYHVCRLSRAIDKTGRQTKSVEGRKNTFTFTFTAPSDFAQRIFKPLPFPLPAPPMLAVQLVIHPSKRIGHDLLISW